MSRKGQPRRRGYYHGVDGKLDLAHPGDRAIADALLTQLAKDEQVVIDAKNQLRMARLHYDLMVARRKAEDAVLEVLAQCGDCGCCNKCSGPECPGCLSVGPDGCCRSIVERIRSHRIPIPGLEAAS